MNQRVKDMTAQELLTAVEYKKEEVKSRNKFIDITSDCIFKLSTCVRDFYFFDIYYNKIHIGIMNRVQIHEDDKNFQFNHSNDYKIIFDNKRGYHFKILKRVE